MSIQNIIMLAGGYIVGAVIISLLAAYRLDSRLKGSLPGNRPYAWGFFFGCICMAYAPLAALSGHAMVGAASRAKWAAYEVHGIYALIFAVNTICGWFIIRRKGWAWIVGTVLNPICAFPVIRDLMGPGLANLGFLGYFVWLVNYLYGRRRWAEFHGRASAPAPTGDKPFEPVRLLTSLEAKAAPHDAPVPEPQGGIQPQEHSPGLSIAASASPQAEADTTQGQLPRLSCPEAEVCEICSAADS